MREVLGVSETLGANAAPTAADLIALINAGLSCMKSNAKGALIAAYGVGSNLIALKDLLPHGAFLEIAQQACGCSRQWCARLMRLARLWSEVLSALDWAERSRPDLGPGFSVDGALRLHAQWKRFHLDQHDQLTEEALSSKKRGRPSFKAQAEELRRQLAAAHTEIAALRHEQQRCCGQFLNLPSSPRPAIDEDEKKRIRKVAEHWRRGDYELPAVALSRLQAIAEGHQRTLAELLKECGVELPAHSPP